MKKSSITLITIVRTMNKITHINYISTLLEDYNHSFFVVQSLRVRVRFINGMSSPDGPM